MIVALDNQDFSKCMNAAHHAELDMHGVHMPGKQVLADGEQCRLYGGMHDLHTKLHVHMLVSNEEKHTNTQQAACLRPNKQDGTYCYLHNSKKYGPYRRRHASITFDESKAKTISDHVQGCSQDPCNTS